jgi:hypothetical protein
MNETRPRIHPPARSLEQRRIDRAAGVDLVGRPTARSLGITPRALMRKRNLSMPEAQKLTVQLLHARWRQLGFTP